MYVDPQIIEYAVKIAAATRDLAGAGHPELARYVSFGASPRASINMVLGGRRGWRSCAAATTPCPATRRSWPRTCCGTGSCCPTKRSPTTSRADALLDPLLDSIALPKVEPGVRAHKS